VKYPWNEHPEKFGGVSGRDPIDVLREALTEANRAVSENADMVDEQRERAEAAEQQARDLADALREIADALENDEPNDALAIARAALGRHTQADT